MQSKTPNTESAQVDRFTDRLLNALANLDRYANGYDKKDDYTPPAADGPEPAVRSTD